MGRLSPLGPDDLDDAQRALWDNVTNGSRAGAVGTVPTSLPGPFDAWLRVPAVGLHAARVGEQLLRSAALDPRLRELAILVVAVHYRADVVFASHVRPARKLGVADEVIDALRDGVPDVPTEGLDRLVIDAARCLVARGRWSDAEFAALTASLDEASLAQLVVVVGYYSLVALTVNAFAVDLPDGMAPVWVHGTLDTPAGAP